MSAYAVSARGLAGRKVPQGVLTPMGDLLFSASEPGAWYDPSDMSTLWQDSAGTTPVTAVEQPVGRILDKSGRGNHATQATTTKRPVLSRRVNLLTKTEDFTNVAWVKNGVVNTSDATFAPDGIQSADKQSPANGVGVAAGYSSQTISKPTLAIAYKAVVFAKRGEHDTFGLVVVSDSASNRAGVTVSLASGAITVPASAFGGFSNASAKISDATNGWYRVELSFTTDTISSITFRTYGGSSGGGVGDGVAGIYLWGASITLATDAHLPYQWVNTATDYDADPAKFPAYLRFDGVDDAMVTVGNVNLSGTDKVTVWAGLSVSSSSDQSGIYELGENSTTSNGLSMQCMLSPFTTLRGQAFGTSRGVVDAPGFALNTPYQICAQYDLSAAQVKDEIRLRKNGAYASSPILESSGTGNFSSYPLTIMARGVMGVYTGGRLYSLIVRGAQSNLSQIEATELYIKQKMRMP